MAVVATTPNNAGALLREWRQRRRLSQLDVALRSAVSARHLSFIETGRARPSREMVLHLAQRLEIPLRERNRLLLAAGYAPGFSERALDDRNMTHVREAIERLLGANDPNPALVVDRHWNLVAANGGVDFVVRGVAPELLAAPANVYRIALHPNGLAPRIHNLSEWSAHMLTRLRRELDVAPDPELRALYEEVTAYPGVQTTYEPRFEADAMMLIHTLELDDVKLRLFSAVTTFGTAREITLPELSIESFFPADAETAATLASGVSELAAADRTQPWSTAQGARAAALRFPTPGRDSRHWARAGRATVSAPVATMRS
jgi:transcriptional regulator with XRE-family HTH domain